MGKTKKVPTLTSHVLLFLLAADDILTPWLNPYEARNRVLFGKKHSYEVAVQRLVEKGWIRLVNKDAEKFIKLTKKGELEALLEKAQMPFNGKWDGYWRMVIYDIPEDCNSQRHFFRRLLKINKYKKLQGSVYISPYPLNREAIKYLKKTGLRQYIRIIRIDEIDDDKDLRKIFRLKT